MNQILLFPHEQRGNEQIFLTRGERYNHLLKHLKMELGDHVQVAMLNGMRGTASVREINETGCFLQWETKEKASIPWCDLAVGLCRPLSIKKIIEHGTTSGVGTFYFFPTALAEASYAQSKIFSPENYKKYFYLGLAQSRLYTHEPELIQYSSFAQAIEHLDKKYSQKIFLQSEMSYFSPSSIDINQKTLLVVGPERGWSPEEVIHLKDKKFQGVSVSATTLRVEMACFYGLAQMELWQNQKPQV